MENFERLSLLCQMTQWFAMTGESSHHSLGNFADAEIDFAKARELGFAPENG